MEIDKIKPSTATPIIWAIAGLSMTFILISISDQSFYLTTEIFRLLIIGIGYFSLLALPNICFCMTLIRGDKTFDDKHYTLISAGLFLTDLVLFTVIILKYFFLNNLLQLIWACMSVETFWFIFVSFTYRLTSKDKQKKK